MEFPGSNLFDVDMFDIQWKSEFYAFHDCFMHIFQHQM
jgi:hypothetical protein